MRHFQHWIIVFLSHVRSWSCPNKYRNVIINGLWNSCHRNLEATPPDFLHERMWVKYQTKLDQRSILYKVLHDLARYTPKIGDKKKKKNPCICRLHISVTSTLNCYLINHWSSFLSSISSNYVNLGCIELSFLGICNRTEPCTMKISIMPYLIDATVLNAVYYPRGIMTTTWCPNDSATTLMDVVHNLWR